MGPPSPFESKGAVAARGHHYANARLESAEVVRARREKRVGCAQVEGHLGQGGGLVLVQGEEIDFGEEEEEVNAEVALWSHACAFSLFLLRRTIFAP